jgi:hypothetical protein
VAILPAADAQITREDMLQYLTMAQLVFTVGSTGRVLLGHLLGPLYGRAAYRHVFLDRGWVLHVASLVSAPAAHCGAGRAGLHGTAAGICHLCDGLGTPRDPFHRYGVLVGTNAAVGSHPRVGLTVLVALWMDDFDAKKRRCQS